MNTRGYKSGFHFGDPELSYKPIKGGYRGQRARWNKALADKYYNQYYTLGYSRIDMVDLLYRGELLNIDGDKLPAWFDAQHLEPILDIMDELLIGGPQS